MNGATTDVEIYSLRQAMRYNKPIILVLNKSINTTDIDKDIYEYAKNNGLIISEFLEEPESKEIGIDSQVRLLGQITKGMLVVNAGIHNILLATLVDNVLLHSGNVMCFPDKKTKK